MIHPFSAIISCIFFFNVSWQVKYIKYLMQLFSQIQQMHV